MSELPFVSVIVVNFNGRRHLANCLTSLAEQTYPRHRYEVIVVDNASSDGSVDFLRSDFPWVRLIEASANLGFAAGNNAGFEVARGEWIALLNNDASAEPEWLEAAVGAGEGSTPHPSPPPQGGRGPEGGGRRLKFSRRGKEIGGIASHIVFRDAPERVNSTGLIVLRDGRGADRDFGKTGVLRERGDVFGGCGAGLVLRRTMLDELGLFDSKLFMYYEDLDLAWRAQRRGWRFVYEPRARVHHVFGASAGVASPLQTRFVERNRCLVNLRHAPLPVAIATALGSFARLGRSVWRQQPLKQQWASLKAIGGIATSLLPVVLARWQSRSDLRQLAESRMRKWLGKV
ncbi:MAG: glycosyltransferase family 2 protein [Gemmataceae bacterium]